MEERLEEGSRDGGPSIFRKCIYVRVANNVSIEKAKPMEEIRAAVKKDVRDQIGLAI